jgi:hypothetical protein
VSSEYKKVIEEKINPDLPKYVKINYIHYDMKAKIKEEKNYPFGLFERARRGIDKIQFFAVEPSKKKESNIFI